MEFFGNCAGNPLPSARSGPRSVPRLRVSPNAESCDGSVGGDGEREPAEWQSKSDHFPTCASTIVQSVDPTSHRPQLEPTVSRGITSESADCVLLEPRHHANCKQGADTTCSVIHIDPVSVLTNDRDVINVSECSSIFTLVLTVLVLRTICVVVSMIHGL